VLRRGALIFLFGLVLNWFPFFQWGEIKGLVDPSSSYRVVRYSHRATLSSSCALPVQRIGVAYIAAGVITLADRTLAASRAGRHGGCSSGSWVR
jgi:hypothetical protein